MTMITEGGNVFDDVGPIKKEYVGYILDTLKTMLPDGLELIPNIGSAGFKVSSGDMDVFIDAAQAIRVLGAKDEKSAKVLLKQWVEKNGYQSALSGRNVHVRIPLPDHSAGQVDLMIIPNAAKVAPFHTHGPSGQYNDPDFKGGQLFIMYSSLAKALNLKFSPFEGKLVDRATNEVMADNKDDVAKILLNKNATAADLSSVKSIIKALANDPRKEEKLAQARADATKGLITLPESVQPGSTLWFRTMADLFGPKQ